jgi:hypothetical protein
MAKSIPCRGDSSPGLPHLVVAIRAARLLLTSWRKLENTAGYFSLVIVSTLEALDLRHVMTPRDSQPGVAYGASIATLRERVLALANDSQWRRGPQSQCSSLMTRIDEIMIIADDMTTIATHPTIPADAPMILRQSAAPPD